VAKSELVQNDGKLTGFATFLLLGTTGILGTLLFCLPGCSWLVYGFLVPWCWGIERGTSSRVLAIAGFLCGTILVAAGCIFLITDTTGPYLGALLLLPIAVVAGAPLLLGGLRIDTSESVHCRQSVFFAVPNKGIEASYDKFALVPFCERPIPAVRWMVRWMGIPIPEGFSVFSTLLPGAEPRVLTVSRADGELCRVGVCIGYDLFFPEAFARYWGAAAPSRPPEFFVVCSDYSWLGPGLRASCLQRRCLAAAQLRAVQTSRSVLQVAIGGATAVVDQRGRILDKQTMPESLKSMLRTRIAVSNQSCGVTCREPAIVDASVFLALAAAALGWPLLVDVSFVRPERIGGAHRLTARAVAGTEPIAFPSRDDVLSLASAPPMLTVIVPVYNESDTIDELLRRVVGAPYTKQVIVVDDGSTDETDAASDGPAV
jgi:hypothetical protein